MKRYRMMGSVMLNVVLVDVQVAGSLGTKQKEHLHEAKVDIGNCRGYFFG